MGKTDGEGEEAHPDDKLFPNTLHVWGSNQKKVEESLRHYVEY